MGAVHPVAWYHEFEGGRVFYTAMGHTEESFSEEPYLRHLTGAVQWAGKQDKTKAKKKKQ
ncbi:MAG: ThuA domain-containing protein [Bacteroidia bacterium]|nr:ThuA domain-containing protein [Bacteroidia bacterium]